jgi:SHS2 domain-containing protein
MAPRSPESNYRRMDPTADCGIQVTGIDLKTLYENAGLALFHLIAGVHREKTDRTHEVRVSGSDWPDLMVDWLRELLYFWNGNELLINDIEIKEILPFQITAAIHTKTFNPKQHRLNHDIKAVTYHRIQVAQTQGGWKARIVFDV